MIKINENLVLSEDAFLDRFNRQIKIPNWGDREQKKIFDKKILIIGDSILGEMALAGLASFGARNLFYQDYQEKAHRKSYFSHVNDSGTRLEKIVRTVARINPYARIYGYKAPFTKLFFRLENFTPEIIIDTTNNLGSKEMILDYLESNKKTKLISGISNSNACAVSFYDPFIGNYEDILNPKIEIERYLQGGFTSNIAAGLIIEEFRKSIFNLDKDDKNSRDTIYYNQNSHERNSPRNDFRLKDFFRNYKIFLAGCGGTGTYAGLSLAQEGFKNISFVDMDIVEDTNLNRQILFYEDIEERKSSSLSKKLKDAFKINPRVFYGKLDDTCGELLEKNKYDLILGCFDNTNARVFLNNHAIKQRIPYIDGSTTYKSGEVRIYIPEKTACIRCKKGLNIEEEVKDNSCDNSLPSVISPNMIIGSAMVGEVINYFSGNFKNIFLNYDTNSNKRIMVYPDEGRTKDCNCREELKNENDE